MITDIEKLAKSCYPNEMVGYVLGGKFFPLENISKRPEVRYQLSLTDSLFLADNYKKITALVHSHTQGMDNNPSDADLQAQMATKIPFWIIATDGHNVTDIKEVCSETN